LGKSAESRAHAMAKCPFLKNRCFRCWDDSHRGVQCTLHPKFSEVELTMMSSWHHH
jgi:Fe-S-cluster containining protein